MPELPEVETIVRALRPALVGKTILSADLLWKRTLAAPSPEAFKKRIKGQQILSVSRRAKFCNFQLQPFENLTCTCGTGAGRASHSTFLSTCA